MNNPAPTFLLAVLLLLPVTRPTRATAEPSRTDINPALLFWQAVAQVPELGQADQDHLHTNEWRGRELDARATNLLGRFNTTFQILRQAARQTAPTEWGCDLAQGPELLLPHLGRAKQLAKTARLRARWHLENHRPDAARDEILATLAAGRRISTDRILISALVQFAIENILISGVAENWFRFDDDSLRRIRDGWLAAPARGSIATCIQTERVAMRDWIVRRIEEYRASSSSEAEAMRKATTMLEALEPEQPELTKAAVRSAENSTAGLLRLLQGLDPYYDDAARLATASAGELADLSQAFGSKVGTNANAFVRLLLPALQNNRSRELGVEVRAAMLRAAIQHRLEGSPPSAGILDPLTGQSFELAPFKLAGVERGFQVRSKAMLREERPSLIFVQRDGPAFYLDGLNVGKTLNP